MNTSRLIGCRVMRKSSRYIGKITRIEENKVYVQYDEGEVSYPFPAAFSNTLELEDEPLQDELKDVSNSAEFDIFRNRYSSAVIREMQYLKTNGEKHYRATDGTLLNQERGGSFVYVFDTDTELHLPDGTELTLYVFDTYLPAQVIDCEDFTITFRTNESLGTDLEMIEFSAESWRLLQFMVDRLAEIDPVQSRIAYQVACCGKNHVSRARGIVLGQDAAIRKSQEQPITFIWGPPGTGKTDTLAKIAMEFMNEGKRVLMLSYSNVSVDGALLRVAKKALFEPGEIIRYGYPRNQELLESDTLTSYAFAMKQSPELIARIEKLNEEKNKLKKKDNRRVEINHEISRIRNTIKEKESQIVHRAMFVATTLTKAAADKTIYTQRFDLVMVDEASMAYIPQIILSANLATQSFCCFGDFKQLPAIVQDPKNVYLNEDIFQYTGIEDGDGNPKSHDWLVMLDIQYRMHPDISSFVSEYMYGHLLKSADSIYQQKQKIADIGPFAKQPMGMIDLSGMYSVCVRTPDNSRINLLSAMISVRLAEYYARHYQVGIITPYSAQARLILQMIRDLKEKDGMSNVTCATVHQFQGSEEPVIIYDAVDCFRMPYPGTLLTKQENHTADRLFNVALTRSQGKFVIVANIDYFERKNLSSKLLFSKLINKIQNDGFCLDGDQLLEEIGSNEQDQVMPFLGDRDEENSWERYLDDIDSAKRNIFINLPGMIEDDEDALDDFLLAIEQADERGISITVRKEENVSCPPEIGQYVVSSDYVTTPFTLIDQRIIWFGEPLADLDFRSGGDIIPTQYYPCMRFEGEHTARIIRTFYSISGKQNKKDTSNE